MDEKLENNVISKMLILIITNKIKSYNEFLSYLDSKNMIEEKEIVVRNKNIFENYFYKKYGIEKRSKIKGKTNKIKQKNKSTKAQKGCLNLGQPLKKQKELKKELFAIKISIDAKTEKVNACNLIVDNRDEFLKITGHNPHIARTFYCKENAEKFLNVGQWKLKHIVRQLKFQSKLGDKSRKDRGLKTIQEQIDAKEIKAIDFKQVINNYYNEINKNSESIEKRL